jgi:hypothetical protein
VVVVASVADAVPKASAGSCDAMALAAATRLWT